MGFGIKMIPLTYQITTDIAWVAVIGLFFIYIQRTAKKSGQYNYHCPICNLDVRKIKENNKRYLKLIAHDKFTWRNPLSFYQVYYFCGFNHLETWVGGIGKIDKPEMIPETSSE